MNSKRIAVVGCGAVTQRNYLPALKEVSDCVVEWFADTNRLNAEQAAKEYGRGDVTSDYTQIVNKVDAAIVAVPNFLHSKVAMDFLKAGRDVLCEKPIADNIENALEMIHASRLSGARLAVNFVRRRFESYRAVKLLLTRSFAGKVRSIDYREGDLLAGWPFSSSYLLDKKKSGGGVLIDWGSHKLDILNWLFGYNWELVSYKDDGFGRIESNCAIDFRIKSNQDNIPCHVELSYQRRLGSRMILNCDSGSMVVDESDNGIRLRVESQNDLIIETGRAKTYSSYFAEQIRSFISGASDQFLAGEDAINSLMFIEECYKHRHDLTYPWEGGPASEVGQHILRMRNKKILVVGASGFLGARLAERFALDFGLNVRATFHTAARATRIARLPVELVECNLLEPSEVLRAVEGCDVIVNCAVGKAANPNDKKIANRVYTDGTRNLLDAAKRTGVRKFVHISSCAVLGFKHNSNSVDESFPIKSRYARDFYENGKISQEKIVMEYASDIPTVILRPTLIYGPFSEEWAVDLTLRLREGKPTLVKNGGTANLVYIDDVADAILLAIDRDEGDGRTLIVNDDEEIVAWNDYVSRFANLLHISPNMVAARNLYSQRLRALISLCADSAKACRDNMRSRELLMLLANIPIVLVVGTKFIRGERKTRIEGSLLSTKENPTSGMRGRLAKYETIPRALYENLTCHALFSSALARSTIGWKPQTKFAEGIRRTLLWTEWSGLCEENR